MIKITNGIAIAGIFSPAWLPGLQQVSEIAALFLPIVSIGWIFYQIIKSLREKK